MLYRTEVESGNIKYFKKKYFLIYVLDNNWRLPKSNPFKYIHLLQIAGCDRFYKSMDLADENLNPNPDCELMRYLENELECKKLLKT